MTQNQIYGLGVLLLALMAPGCTGTGSVAKAPGTDPAGLMAGVGIEPPRARGVGVWEGSGRRAGWDELVSAASGADVVLIGETHGHPLGLASAAALFEDVIASGQRPVLALEFFERDEQVALDDFLAGVTDEAGMLKAAAKTSPGSYPPGHRAMILAAKRAGVPVIAANAPRRYVRLARLEGYDRLQALTPEQRRLFDLPPQEPSASYRAAFDAVMNGNAGLSDAQKADAEFMAERARTLDATFRSQWLWDWTMGSSVARATGSGRPVVLVVGMFHVEHEGGTVQAVRVLRPGTKVVSVVFADEADTDPPAPGRADFVVRVGASAGASASR